MWFTFHNLYNTFFRISNCSTDSTHPQIFSFISTDVNDILECHAFLCPKRKIAETVTLTVAQAFNAVYESWKILPSAHPISENSYGKGEPQTKISSLSTEIVEEDKLIDFESDDDVDFRIHVGKKQQQNIVAWVRKT